VTTVNVSERERGGQAADSDWSVPSPHPFGNGIRTSYVVTSGECALMGLLSTGTGIHEPNGKIRHR
jgi:hypothetical protein